jgi:hypothetical protein
MSNLRGKLKSIINLVDFLFLKYISYLILGLASLVCTLPFLSIGFDYFIKENYYLSFMFCLIASFVIISFIYLIIEEFKIWK